MKTLLCKAREYSLHAYYVAFSLYFMFSWISRINTEVIIGIPISYFKAVLRITVIFLLLWRYFFVSFNWKGYLLTSILAAIGFITWQISGEGWLFWLILFLITAKEIKLQKLALISLIQSAAILFIVPMLTLFGVLDNIQIQKGNITRNTLGFSHPNNIGVLLLIICVALSVLFFRQKLLLTISIIIALTVFNLFISYSRSGAVLSVIQIVLLLIFYFIHSEKMKSILSYCMLSVVGLCTLLSYFAMVFYRADNQIWGILNKILSGRLRLAHGYFEMYPLTLFGRDYAGSKPIAWEFDGIPSNFMVDNAYAHLLLRYGIIPTVIFLAAYLFVLYKLAANNSWNGIFFGLVLFAIYGLSETHGIRIDTNFLLYYLGSYLLFENDYFTEKLIRPSAEILAN